MATLSRDYFKAEAYLERRFKDGEIVGTPFDLQLLPRASSHPDRVASPPRFNVHSESGLDRRAGGSLVGPPCPASFLLAVGEPPIGNAVRRSSRYRGYTLWKGLTGTGG